MKILRIDVDPITGFGLMLVPDDYDADRTQQHVAVALGVTVVQIQRGLAVDDPDGALLATAGVYRPYGSS